MKTRVIVFTAVTLLAFQGACLKAIQRLIPEYTVTCKNNSGKSLVHVNLWFDGKLFGPSHNINLPKGKVDSASPIDYTVPKSVRVEWDEEQGSYLDNTLKYIHHTYTLAVKKHLPKGWRKCCDEIIFIFNEDNTISLHARVFTGEFDDPNGRSMKEYDSKGNVVSQW